LSNVLGRSDELARTLLKLEEQGVYQGLVVGKAEIETKVEGADGKHRHVDGPKSSVKQGKVISATRGQKFAKTLIVVGRPTKAVEVSGLPFDIVPLDLPSKWRAGARLRFRVLYNGAPLADLPVRGAAVPAGEKPDRENWTLNAKTDRAGEVSFDFSAGRWHLEAEREFAAEPARRADYDRESYVTSVSFEVRP
jgi:uncharacterized GH25 family protein